MKHSVKLLLLCLMLVAPSVHAQSAADRLQARKLATEGQKALIEKDFDAAADRFGTALGLVDAPTLVLGLAQAQVGQNKLADAVTSYKRVINSNIDASSPPAFQRALETAEKELAEVEPRAPRLAIEINGISDSTPLTVMLNGATLSANSWNEPQLVNPGTVSVRAEAPDFTPAEVEIEASEGDQSLVATLNLERLPATEPEPQPVATKANLGADSSSGGFMDPPLQRTLGYVGIGVGAASIVTGVVTRIMASSKRSDLEEAGCLEASNGDLVCPAGNQSDVDSYSALDTTSTVTLIAGGVLAGAGLTLLLTAGGDEPEQAGIHPYVGLGSLGMTGRF